MVRCEMNREFIIIFALLKGFIHATIIPYIFLWIFQGFGLKAFAISALYLFVVAILYKKSTRHDISGAAFFWTLKVVLVIMLLVTFIVATGTLQN